MSFISQSCEFTTKLYLCVITRRVASFIASLMSCLAFGREAYLSQPLSTGCFVMDFQYSKKLFSTPERKRNSIGHLSWNALFYHFAFSRNSFYLKKGLPTYIGILNMWNIWENKAFPDACPIGLFSLPDVLNQSYPKILQSN